MSSQWLAQCQRILEKATMIEDCQEYRLHHWQRFLEQGIPQRSHERWKYADLTLLKNFQVHTHSESELNAELDRFIADYKKAQPNVFYFVFIDGEFASQYSDTSLLPQVKVGSLRTTRALHDFNIPEHYPFAHLNAAVFTDGLSLHVPKDCVLDRPIQLLVVSTQENNMTQLRNVISIGARSQVTFLEEYVALQDNNYWMNTLTTVQLQADAQFKHCKLQRESTRAIHLAHTFVTLAQGSQAALTHFSIGAQFSRDEVLMQIAGKQVQCSTAGFYQPQRVNQYVDQHVDIEHLAPQSQSEMFYKGIIGQGATAVFNGRLYVDCTAQKTVAHQANQHLLLSAQANAYAKPELEINADDVKCKHGSATGQLNEEALFYLRSRGLKTNEAMQMLLSGFAEEIIQRAPSMMRERIKTVTAGGAL